MSPLTHFLGSWLVAVTVSKDPRDRALITWAGVLPDADGLGVVADVIKSVATGQECKFEYYQHYHHLLLHGWPGALLMAGLLTLWARRKGVVFVWALVTFHLHLLCDYLGSRGPTVGDRWPICYSEPLFRHPIWFWKYQWALDGWQNRLIFIVLQTLATWVTAKRGYGFLEAINRRLDARLIPVWRKWWRVKA